MAIEHLQPPLVEATDYTALKHLPEGGIAALQSGKYELEAPFKGEHGTYKVYLFINKEAQEFSSDLPWVVRGGVADTLDNYEGLCEQLATSGAAIYIEQTSRGGHSDSTKSVFEEDAQDVATVVRALGVRKANLVSHSLSTPEAAYAALQLGPDGNERLYKTIVMCAPVGVEPGSLRRMFRLSHKKVKSLARGEQSGGAEEPQRAQATLRRNMNVKEQAFESARKTWRKRAHLKRASEGELGKGILHKLAENGDVDIIIIVPRDDPYTYGANFPELHRQLEAIARENGHQLNIRFLSPIKVALHGFVYLIDPRQVAELICNTTYMAGVMKDSQNSLLKAKAVEVAQESYLQAA